LVAASFVIASYSFAGATPSKPYSTNDQPTTHIRFDTATGADAKRQQLIDYIWSDGLPTSTMPIATTNVGFNSDLNAITQSAVSRVDRLDAKVYGLDNIAYLLSPTNTANANRLAIVYMGHASSAADALGYGVGNTANHLLQAGYSVMAMQMPLMGWNRSYNTCAPPGLGAVTITNLGSSIAHDELFAKVEPTLGGATFRFFLEPTIQAINYFKNTNTNAKDISMIGLSGGGWTTSMAAAVDNRIRLSIPVAGSAPLYVQNHIGSTADTEQVYPPMFDERINADGSGGGMATWLEIYALGGYGAGRRQIMVTIPNEPVGLFPTTWVTDSIDGASVKGLVTGTFERLHSGQWQQAYDMSAPIHQISPWTIGNVIIPALQTPEPPANVSGAIGLFVLGCYAWKRRH
jgi:hypothetical protein